jgi:hypothetical protein
MGNGNATGQETKRFPDTTKRFPDTTKRIDEFSQRIDATKIAYSDAGAYGRYVVKVAGGDEFTVAAISIRVLNNGELNLLTDQGRWILFAPDTWKSVLPKQPLPDVCPFCGHRPYTPNAAQ